MYLNLNIFKNSQKIVTIQVATKARKPVNSRVVNPPKSARALWRSGTNFPLDQYETFAKLSLFVISTEGRNLNALESLRFLVVDTPRNDKIQRSQYQRIIL